MVLPHRRRLLSPEIVTDDPGEGEKPEKEKAESGHQFNRFPLFTFDSWAVGRRRLPDFHVG